MNLMQASNIETESMPIHDDVPSILNNRTNVCSRRYKSYGWKFRGIKGSVIDSFGVYLVKVPCSA